MLQKQNKKVPSPNLILYNGNKNVSKLHKLILLNVKTLLNKIRDNYIRKINLLSLEICSDFQQINYGTKLLFIINYMFSTFGRCTKEKCYCLRPRGP